MWKQCLVHINLYNIGFLFHRKRFGKNNVILSDIRKPPSNVFHSGESHILCCVKIEFCCMKFIRFRHLFTMFNFFLDWPGCWCVWLYCSHLANALVQKIYNTCIQHQGSRWVFVPSHKWAKSWVPLVSVAVTNTRLVILALGTYAKNYSKSICDGWGLFCQFPIMRHPKMQWT